MDIGQGLINGKPSGFWIQRQEAPSNFPVWQSGVYSWKLFFVA